MRSKWQHYPAVWKHARVIPQLLQDKDTALPSSYKTHLLDTVRKLFEKILLSRIMTEINSGGLLRDE